MMVTGEFSEDEVEKSSGSSEESESTSEPGEKKPKQVLQGKGGPNVRSARLQFSRKTQVYAQGQGSESWSKKRKNTKIPWKIHLQ